MKKTNENLYQQIVDNENREKEIRERQIENMIKVLELCKANNLVTPEIFNENLKKLARHYNIEAM